MLHEADLVERERRAWLNALPVLSFGALLDSDSFRVPIALRVDADICIPHSCRCSGIMDSRGLHSLFCKYSAGHFKRDSAMHDVIMRGLQKARLPSVLEPPGLDKEMDHALMVFPFSGGTSWFGIGRVLILFLGYT